MTWQTWQIETRIIIIGTPNHNLKFFGPAWRIYNGCNQEHVHVIRMDDPIAMSDCRGFLRQETSSPVKSLFHNLIKIHFKL